MSGFPTLKPAFTVRVNIDAPLAVGSASRSNPLQVVPMIGGTVKGDSGFSPALDAEFVGVGNDYIHADADGKHLRLNAHGVLKTKDDALLYLNYTGVVTLTPTEQAVFAGTAPEGSTPFGNLFTHFTFETGDERYKDLENRVFVGQGRFNIESGKPVVEYRVSQVLHG
ncbi:hypothetical protein BDV38DRAFT_160118 [Aspergillus pseudotamarii]|uniref:Uncharacterized protein n=4 Tax=Aspergillus subgen. Circumdati TaxID=2720871 RepID=A0A5N7AEL7_9EURO|nr:uncharacterized protein BDV38DRAFT_160118 [Aspergillus pseudotamarii]XP_031931395.1 uncharacterized protein BDV27DRAFT_48302 [Aspergillus caelatus]KAE8158473.1 hypothetical protein BDV40DRAFT_19199 [Aspergillus tamarii]KAE8411812.1 hypothetical protein BDV36DRAFT_273438 [Aspergillus pseudocaelatus]KAE8134478.1 hypothetical protein BDV38DRAFT_160118 [Aspergillus pseudotamarii]KAE8368314.1 hypothetical protein BDV27DRAFT_48302 [Aspergillus caelatus]